MTTGALVLFAVYLGVGFGLRTWVQVRRTGDTGFRGISGRFGSTEWWAGVCFVVALVTGVLGPITALLGVDPVGFLTAPAVQWIGAATATAGIVATFVAQLEMGSNWRIGVDQSEHTELVTSGAFSLVRNPIFTAMGSTGIGLALMVPNIVSLLGMILLIVALELQVRVVEEPFLTRLHGAPYTAYVARVGRFVPWLGRMSPETTTRSVA